VVDTTSFSIPAIEDFKLKALQWANQFRVCCLLDSNNYSKDSYTEFDWLLAVDALDELQVTVDAFESLKLFHENTTEKIFGFLSYDLKNQLENLDSNNFDGIGFPPTYFFKPRYILSIKGDSVFFNRNYPEAFEIIEQINSQKLNLTTSNQQLTTGITQLIPRTPKEKYISNVNRIKSQIEEGDFYELNYCCEFYAEATVIEPLSVFKKLNDSASAPFSSFFKLDDKYLLCSSPERFLKKQGTQLISQPIKGTIRKGKDAQENEQLKQKLQNDSKERAENVMIVDLVRNDLAKSSKPGTVKVAELFGVYEFKRVNQLISTVTSQIKDNVHFVDAIKNAFPMGSMTGAPKVEVMKNIEQFEDQKRGLYSGALGYISASGDFDFNVVIRSVLYNASRSYISVQAGGAITFDANAEQEYEELLLKAKGMLEALDATILL
jgi:para-aminobenzoate synthetase component 1